jgi:serine/threonine protein kinase
MIGGMGEIFLARQSGVAGFDRLVILKTLLPELAEQPGFVDQFLDEARVAATLNHPNIVNIYEVGEWGGLYVIAMEYIKGDNLGRLMAAISRANDKMPHRVAARIVMDASSALDHAHFALDANGKPLGIVHRDIGLQNIMVRTDGVTKVVDFGIARAANRSTRTRTGLIKGKLQYMSPEQVSGGELDGRSDEFSLGVVLWEMITGQRLFKADNEFQTMQKLLTEPIPVPSSLEPTLDLDLEKIVMRMLQREREKRYQRCVDVTEALRSYLSASGGEVPERDVAKVVEKYVGTDLAEATRDLTPSKETFASSLSPIRQVRASSASTVEVFVRRPIWKIVAMTAIPLVILAALGGFLGMRYLKRPSADPKPAGAGRDNQPTVGMALDIRKPEGAKIIVDGVEWPEKTPTIVRGLSMGPHEVQLALPNRKPLVKKVSLQVGKPVIITEAPPATGMVLDIRDPVGAQVLVDGDVWKDPVPTIITGLNPGAHEVRLVEKGKPPVFRNIELGADTPILIQATAYSDMPTLKLDTKPDGATVRVNDKILGSTPITVTSLEPDVVHILEISKSGYDWTSQSVVLEAKQTKNVEVTLVKSKTKPGKDKKKELAVAAAPPPPPVGPRPNGYLTLNTTPWVKVAIDDRPFGSTPFYKVELSPGSHSLSLTNEEAGVNVTRKIVIEPGQTTKLNLSLVK